MEILLTAECSEDNLNTQTEFGFPSVDAYTDTSLGLTLHNAAADQVNVHSTNTAIFESPNFGL